MLTAVLPCIPFLAALILLFIPASSEKQLKTLTLLAAGVCLGIVMMLILKWNHLPGYQWTHTCPVFGEMGISYQTGLDGLGLVFCLLTGLATFAGALIAIQTSKRLKEFLFHFLILTGSLYGIFTSLNLFFAYVFYEMTLIPIFILTGLHCSGAAAPSQPAREAGMMRLALFMTAGAMLALLAILGLYKVLGPGFLDLTQAQAMITAKGSLLTPEKQKWLCLLLIFGFGIMTSLWPFHNWSPTAYASMPGSVALLHAGVKAGPYFIIRIALAYLPEGFKYWSTPLAVLAAIGILYGGYAAIRQKNLKTMTAFSSVSHMGYVLLALAVMTPASVSAAVFVTFAHGLLSVCLFGLIGHLEQTSGSDVMANFGGLGKSMPFFSVCFVLTCMASSGIPGFANFPGELMVFISSWKTFPAGVICGVLGVLLTAVYMFRAAHAVVFGSEHRSISGFSEQSANTQTSDMTGIVEKLPFIILLAALLFFGIFPGMILSFAHTTAGIL